MNRRISRIALLVVLLLVSVAGVFWDGTSEASKLALAQNDCSISAVPNGSATSPTSENASPTAENQVPSTTIYSVSMTLREGDRATFESSGTVGIWVNTGSVTLTICSGEAVVNLPNTSEFVTVNADSIEIPAGGSIFVAPDTEYVLIGSSQQAALAAIGSQPMTTRSLCAGGGC